MTGCKSTGVLLMSHDSYYIGKKDGSPGFGVSLSNKTEVYKEAYFFCGEQDLDVKVVREFAIPSDVARLGSYELYFKCVPPEGFILDEMAQIKP